MSQPLWKNRRFLTAVATGVVLVLIATLPQLEPLEDMLIETLVEVFSALMSTVRV